MSLIIVIVCVTVTVPADVAPTFTRPLSDVMVNDGEQLTLACEVTAMPDPEVSDFLPVSRHK